MSNAQGLQLGPAQCGRNARGIAEITIAVDIPAVAERQAVRINAARTIQGQRVTLSDRVGASCSGHELGHLEGTNVGLAACLTALVRVWCQCCRSGVEGRA